MTPTDPSPENEPDLLVDDAGAVRTLTLNRPAAFNSFTLSLKAALLAALADAASTATVRALVITGRGRAFCAGQDLKEHQALVAAGDPRVATAVREFYNPLAMAITGLAVPVVAAINGPAAGAGAGLTFLCDLRVAARSASFSMAFAGAGLGADTGASFTLPRLVGHGRASRLLLLGDKVDAQEALRIGMVDEVVADGELMDTTAAIAGRLAAGPTRALGHIKAALHHSASHDLESALAFEDRAQTDCFSSPDHQEAIAAFTQKRPPKFTGS